MNRVLRTVDCYSERRQKMLLFGLKTITKQVCFGKIRLLDEYLKTFKTRYAFAQ